MRKQKEYSTLKVQQEMLKDTYNEKNGVFYAWDEVRWLYDKKYDTDYWFVYKGVALYRSDKTLLNLPVHFTQMNIQNLLHSLSDAYYPLMPIYNMPVSVDKKRSLLHFQDEKHKRHIIDFKFFEIVNLDPFECQLFIPEVGKNGIVAVRDEDDFLLAGIMEVK